MLECSRHIFSAPFTQTIDHFLACLSALCQGILRLWRHHRIYFAVNQYESNSLHPADHVIPFCQAHDIVVQAWGPLGQGQGGLFTNPIVTQISGKHHKTPAQIILRFRSHRDTDQWKTSQNTCPDHPALQPAERHWHHFKIRLSGTHETES